MDTQVQQAPNEPISPAKTAYEARKEEKLRAKVQVASRTPTSAVGRRLGIATVVVLMLALLGYGVYMLIKRSTPQGGDQSAAIPLQPPSHIQIGATHDPYNSNPPTSGPHYEVPAKPGFRTEPIVDEHLVHSMEHGLVWISYKPSVGEAAKATLKELQTPWTVITAREANDTDIAVAAWGRLDKFNLENGSLDETATNRIKDFIKRYMNRGPEKIPAGQHGGV